MKVFITGGAGFIGSYFHSRLNADGHSCVLYDLHAPEWNKGDSLFHAGDVRDEAAATAAMKGCDAVLHLAAAHHDFGISTQGYFDVNEGGSKAICKAMEANGIGQACFYSTVAVYGNAPEPRTEETAPQPISPYGESKLAAEKVFKAWTDGKSGRSCLVIRPTVTFGPRNFANMYSLIRQIDSGRFLPIGDGKNIKSLSYVENIVDATLYLWNLGGSGPRLGSNGQPQPSGFGVFNYIDKPDLTSHQITVACYRGLGKRPPRITVPLGLAVLLGLPFDLAIKLTGKNLPISTARMKKLCTQTKFEADRVAAAGFKPKVPLEEGIDRMVKWYVKEGKHQTPSHAGGE